MPFYEYECSSCKFYTEVMQKISDAPLTKCPSCGKKALKKLVSAPNFRLKGGGWYETDFKGDKENKRNLAGADEESASKSEASTASGSPKPDAAPKTEASSADAPKTESGKGEAASKPAAKADGGSGAAESKGASGRRSGSGRSSSGASGGGTKAPVRSAAAKARPPISKPASKKKAKPAVRKKARR